MKIMAYLGALSVIKWRNLAHISSSWHKYIIRVSRQRRGETGVTAENKSGHQRISKMQYSWRNSTSNRAARGSRGGVAWLTMAW